MADSDVRALNALLQSGLQRRVDALTDDSDRQEYTLLLSQVRALRALAGRLHQLDHASRSDASLEAERARTMRAMDQLAKELGR